VAAELSPGEEPGLLRWLIVSAAGLRRRAETRIPVPSQLIAPAPVRSNPDGPASGHPRNAGAYSPAAFARARLAGQPQSGGSAPHGRRGPLLVDQLGASPRRPLGHATPVPAAGRPRLDAATLRGVRTRLTDPRAAATADLWLFRLAENRSRLMGLRKEADHAGTSRGSTSRARAHGRPGRPLGGDCRGTRRRRRTSVRRPVRRRTHRRRLPRSGCGRRASTGVICRTRACPLRSGIELDAAIASRRAPACLRPSEPHRPGSTRRRQGAGTGASPQHNQCTHMPLSARLQPVLGWRYGCHV
jgi:hypothetical protein